MNAHSIQRSQQREEIWAVIGQFVLLKQDILPYHEAMPSPTEILPLWLKLEECSHKLKRLRRLQPNKDRIDHWPGAEMHHVPTLVLCIAGQTRITYERDRKLDLNVGEGVIIGPGIFHAHEKLRSGCATLSQGITPRHSDFNLQNKDTHFYGHIPIDRVENVFHGIINDRHEKPQQWLKHLKSILHCILHEYEERTHSVPSSFHKMFHYFVRYVYEGASVEDIIQAGGLSRSRAYKIWSDNYSVPLRMAICQQRLGLAKLLLQTDLSIEAIAERCGFSSRQQMTRLFQEHEHCSPRQWREQ